MQSWYSIRAADKAAAEILVYDEIGGFGVGARSFVDDLKALGAVKNLTVRINSPGGSSFDGVANVAELLKEASMPEIIPAPAEAEDAGRRGN